ARSCSIRACEAPDDGSKRFPTGPHRLATGITPVATDTAQLPHRRGDPRAPYPRRRPPNIWTPYGFSKLFTGAPLSGMSIQHPFGVDQSGRDVLSRVLYGGHIVLLLSISGTFLGLVVGATIGLLSGYIGGWLDEIVQRVLEAIISIPFVVLALMIIAAGGPELSGHPVLY